MEMTAFIKPLVFYTFAGIAVGSALMVVILRNPLYSASTLVLTFFSIAGIYVLLGSEIIAVIQVLVYAGAIMVLVIFVIMFLDLRPSLFKMKPAHVFRSTLAVIFTLGIFLTVSSLLTQGVRLYMEKAKKGDITLSAMETYGSFQLFGASLFTEFLLPFELASLLLTVAIIGVVVLIRGMYKTKVKPEAGRKFAAESGQKEKQGGK